MAYVKLKGAEKVLLESAPKYFFDGGIPVSDAWLIENENIYPVVDQDLSNEEEVIELIENPVEEWTVNENYVTRTFKVLKDDEIEPHDDFYQYPELNDQEDWKHDGIYIYRTYKIITKSIIDLKIELKDKLTEKRKAIEIGGFKYGDDPEDQGKYILIDSSLESQSKLSIYSITADNYDFISWKSFGMFVSLTPEEIKKVNLSLNLFVKNCFDNEERITRLIDEASDYAELKEIYENEFDEGWPKDSSIYLTGE